MGKNKKSQKVARKTVVGWIDLARFSRGVSSTLERIVLSISTITISNGSANTITSFASSRPQSSGVGFSSFSARYTEYRVLRGRFAITPTALITGGGNPSLILATDQAATATPATVAAVLNINGAKTFYLYNTDKSPITYEIKAIDLEEQLYTPSNVAPTLNFAMVLVAYTPSNATANTVVCQISEEWLVEFKSRQ
jgi:hypothetical protein